MAAENKETPWWHFSVEDVCRDFQTDARQGLSEIEAKHRVKECGLNRLPKGRKISFPLLLFKQFCNFIIWVLIGAAVISAFLGQTVDALAITAIIAINAVLASLQEYRAETSLAALQKLSAPTSKIIREGEMRVLPAEQIVPGDLIFLEAGDLVPADGRIVECSRLTTQEATLTGEPFPVHKTRQPLQTRELSLGDRENMVFSGTEVASGNGHVVITATGLQTEIGKIASLLEKKKDKTPLEVRLDKLGQRLVYACIVIVAIIFGMGMLRGGSWIEMLLTAASLAVAAIPEGLPAIVTTALGIGVRRMAKRKALVRRLPSVETLGCTSVICTDKTGTLTQNEMNVKYIWTNGQYVEVTGTNYIPEGQFKLNQSIANPQQFPDLLHVLQASMLCNHAHLIQEEGHWKIVGDPTEGALLVAAEKAGLKKEVLEQEYLVIGEIPFDSERKRMSVLRKRKDQLVLFVKGAPDIILSRCNTVLKEGKQIPLTEDLKKNIEQANARFASGAFRVLAVARREENLSEPIDEVMENNLSFIGLVAMQDPPRPEVEDAVKKCKQAGIKTVMITGDHKKTGLAVAEEIGLVELNSLALDGLDLDKMNENDLNEKLENIAVFARVSAEHKMRIIRAWKNKGSIVAMAGDGVNDAPAIKEADIGIAMGIKGSDVTKEASDMVITDDNFATIVNAVEEGRGIYDNITKFVSYLLSSNIAEILVIFFGILIGFTDLQGRPFVPLIPVQLLLLNLITDGFPAIALALDPLDPNAMRRPPRGIKEPLLAPRFTVQLLLISLLIAGAALFCCDFGLRRTAESAHTLTLTILVVLELVKVQMVRSQYNMRFFSNPWLMLALVSSFGFQMLVVYVPFFQKIFGTAPLNASEWIVIIAVSLLVWVAGSLINILFKTFRRK